MGKFFIVVFGRETYRQYRLDDIMRNSFNGFVNAEYAYFDTRYYFPALASDSEYYLDVSAVSGWSVTENGTALTGKKQIHDGDYYVVSDGTDTVSLLALEYDNLSMSSTLVSFGAERTLFIGRSEESDIILNKSNCVSRKHASVRTDSQGNAFLDDLSGKTGVYLNGHKVNSSPLKAGDSIYIAGTCLVYYPGMLLVPGYVRTRSLNSPQSLDMLSPSEETNRDSYVRTPRIYKSVEKPIIQIDPPTSPQKAKEMPFILTAGPSLTMSLAMLVSLGISISNAASGGGIRTVMTSGIMAVSMLLGALLWPTLLRRYNKRQLIKAEEHRCKRYAEYLTEKEDEIKRVYDRNTRVWNESLCPAPGELIDFIGERKRRLWERNPDDPDFLTVRLGLGERPFEAGIQVQPKRFVLDEDTVAGKAGEISDRYSVLRDVPITVSLKDKRTVGVVGDTVTIAKAMITNIVSLHSPDEVKLVLVYNPFLAEELGFANDLPHTWSSDRRFRYVATNKSEIRTLFEHIGETVSEREARLGKDASRIPHFVFLVFDDVMTDIPYTGMLLGNSGNLGVSAVFFGEQYNKIPKECTAIIQKNEEICGIYVKNENENRFLRFTADEVTRDDTAKLVSGLATIGVKTEKTKASVPERVSFLDMYQVGNIQALNIQSHWSTNTSNKSLAAPVGAKAGGEVFYLDIHEKYHGCHGLVAGTTGSGKSEFLQAYILSMMINYSPNDVAFVLVDFKGGDMARPFLKSPHLTATISNLSGNTLYRALVSLEAEIKTRQRIFNESAVKLGVDKIDINSYHKYFKEGKLETPLPHLIIVIDEFAQLKSQQPGFMAKLIDIAQVGRSLGIHLILATQKPSGVVDPQIWSNSRFKVCLKVMDKQDSSDMINRPDAALIKLPGRAFVQVGYDEVFELIQSGYSGADYAPQDSFISEDDVTLSCFRTR